MARIREAWPSAFDVRSEERLLGIEHFMPPKIWVGKSGFTLYHSASVPLIVGLHQDHAFCSVPGFREVHMQIVGFGKIQQCHERDVSTLYLEEPMSPGTTHRPIDDAEGNYPQHQIETIAPSVLMAIEMLPDGATPPIDELLHVPTEWRHFLHISDCLPGIADTREGMIQLARDARLCASEGWVDLAGVIERCPPMSYSVELPNQGHLAELGFKERARRCLTHARQTFGAARSKRRDITKIAA